MNKIVNWCKSSGAIIVYASVFLTLIMPWIIKFAGGSIALRIGLLFILLDMGTAIYFGRLMHRHHLPWWYSLFLPLLFGLMVYLRFARYNYWFMPIYWILTLLAWTKD